MAEGNLSVKDIETGIKLLMNLQLSENPQHSEARAAQGNQGNNNIAQDSKTNEALKTKNKGRRKKKKGNKAENPQVVTTHDDSEQNNGEQLNENISKATDSSEIHLEDTHSPESAKNKQKRRYSEDGICSKDSKALLSQDMAGRKTLKAHRKCTSKLVEDIDNETKKLSESEPSVKVFTPEHHRQESPHLAITEPGLVEYQAAVKKFWELPVKKSKKKKKQKGQVNDSKNNEIKSDNDQNVVTKKDGIDQNSVVNEENSSQNAGSSGEKKERRYEKKPKEKTQTTKSKTRDQDEECKQNLNQAKVSEPREKANQIKPAKDVFLDLDGKVQCKKTLKRLEEDRIFPLKKKSLRFTRARYFCRLCDYHMDTVEDCDKHMKDNRHIRRKEINQIESKLNRMPAANSEQLLALDNLLDELYSTHGLTEADMEYRAKLAKDLDVYLKETLPDISVILYGSSKTGIALKDCDLNMDLLVKGEESQAKTLTTAYRVIKESDMYTEVKSDFASTVPCVYFKDKERLTLCQLTIGGHQAPQTSELLAVYADIDPRVRKLGVAFRYFAKICQIDQQEEGSMPAYCFSLMTVFYLQKCKVPVLPVVYVGSTDVEVKSPSKKKQSPPAQKINFEKMRKQGKSWQTLNMDSIGTLWLGLLKFYCIEFDNARNVVSVTRKGTLTRGEKKWNTKRVAIEDPFSTKRNVARSVTNFEVFTYIWDCFRKAYFYFGLPSNYDSLTKKQQNILLQRHSKREKKTTHSKSQGKGLSGLDDGESKEQEGADNSDRESFSASSNLSDEESEDCTVEKNMSYDDTDTRVIHDNNMTEENVDICINKENSGHKTGDLSEADNIVAKICEQDNDSSELASCINKLTLENKDIGGLPPDIVCYNKLFVEVGNEEDRKCENLLDKLGDNTFNQDLKKTCNDVDRGNDAENVSVADTKSTTDKAGPDSSDLSDHESVSDSDKDSVIPNKNTTDQYARKLIDEIIMNSLKSIKINPLVDSTSVNTENESVNNDESVTQSDCNTVSKPNSEERIEEISSTVPVNKQSYEEDMPKLLYGYEFCDTRFNNGKGPKIICSLCEMEGHLTNSCPEEALPPNLPLPPMTKTYLQLLTTTIKQVPRDFGLNEREYAERESIRKELEDFLKELNPNVRLNLFGSSLNGFGFKQSDLDLCITFKGLNSEDDIDKLDPVQIIEETTKKLKTHRGLYNVFPIATAKVPIVKFKHRKSRLEGDISLYNLLALHNTKMIRLYADMDNRVKILGYSLKVFVKVCDIGDASKGSLSSYAYTLMLIYYLQQCNPPVLPVLQEMYPGTEKPQTIIEGWNAWYCDNVQLIQKVWRCKNNQSVGELWSGLFKFYAEDFNLQGHVISIRQHEALTKFEKLWNGRCVAIEDPFDLSHNLGAGLSRKMNQYIMKAFIQGRWLYGCPTEDFPDHYNSLSDYFFDKSLLTDGMPPSDRLCRACNKIGHIAKECPRVQLRKEREKQMKERNDRERIRKEREGNSKQEENSSERQNNTTRKRDNFNDGRQVRNSQDRNRHYSEGERLQNNSDINRYQGQERNYSESRQSSHTDYSRSQGQGRHHSESDKGNYDGDRYHEDHHQQTGLRQCKSDPFDESVPTTYHEQQQGYGRHSFNRSQSTPTNLLEDNNFNRHSQKNYLPQSLVFQSQNMQYRSQPNQPLGPSDRQQYRNRHDYQQPWGELPDDRSPRKPHPHQNPNQQRNAPSSFYQQQYYRNQGQDTEQPSDKHHKTGKQTDAYTHQRLNISPLRQTRNLPDDNSSHNVFRPFSSPLNIPPQHHSQHQGQSSSHPWVEQFLNNQRPLSAQGNNYRTPDSQQQRQVKLLEQDSTGQSLLGISISNDMYNANDNETHRKESKSRQRRKGPNKQQTKK